MARANFVAAVVLAAAIAAVQASNKLEAIAFRVAWAQLAAPSYNHIRIVYLHEGQAEGFEPLLELNHPNVTIKTVDVSKKVNRNDAAKNGFTTFPLTLVRAPSESIEVFDLPLENLQLHVASKGLPANPHLAEKFTSAEAFYASLDESDPAVPVLMRFSIPSCPACHATHAKWYQTVGLLQGRIRFVDVNCEESRAWCLKRGVKEVPSLLLFTGTEEIRYQGLHSVLHYYQFVTSHVELREHAATDFLMEIEAASASVTPFMAPTSTEEIVNTPPPPPPQVSQQQAQRTAAPTSSSGTCACSELEARIASLEKRLAALEARV